MTSRLLVIAMTVILAQRHWLVLVVPGVLAFGFAREWRKSRRLAKARREAEKE
jgi:hypothetical protein